MHYLNLTKYLLILVALSGHLLLGQSDLSSSLILCFGQDGHISLESRFHQPHQALIVENAQQEHTWDCPEEEGCQDIIFSFAQDELYGQSKTPDVLGSLLKDALGSLPYQMALLKQPEFISTQAKPPPKNHSSQALKQIILLI